MAGTSSKRERRAFALFCPAMTGNSPIERNHRSPRRSPLPPGIRFAFRPKTSTACACTCWKQASRPRGRPCVLLLHGLSELSFSWRKVMPALAEAGYHVIAPDQRGYGRHKPAGNDNYDRRPSHFVPAAETWCATRSGLVLRIRLSQASMPWSDMISAVAVRRMVRR